MSIRLFRARCIRATLQTMMITSLPRLPKNTFRQWHKNLQRQLRGIRRRSRLLKRIFRNKPRLFSRKRRQNLHLLSGQLNPYLCQVKSLNLSMDQMQRRLHRFHYWSRPHLWQRKNQMCLSQTVLTQLLSTIWSLRRMTRRLNAQKNLQNPFMQKKMVKVKMGLSRGPQQLQLRRFRLS